MRSRLQRPPASRLLYAPSPIRPQLPEKVEEEEAQRKGKAREEEEDEEIKNRDSGTRCGGRESGTL